MNNFTSITDREEYFQLLLKGEFQYYFPEEFVDYDYFDSIGELYFTNRYELIPIMRFTTDPKIISRINQVVIEIQKYCEENQIPMYPLLSNVLEEFSRRVVT